VFLSWLLSRYNIRIAFETEASINRPRRENIETLQSCRRRRHRHRRANRRRVSPDVVYHQHFSASKTFTPPTPLNALDRQRLYDAIVISCFEADIIPFTNRGYQCSTGIERHVVHWDAWRRTEGVQVNATLAYPPPELYTSPSAGDQPTCHESSVDSYRAPTSSPPQNVRQYRQHVTYLSSRADSISRRSSAVAAATPTRRTATLTSTSVDDRRQLFDCQLSIASSSSNEGTCINPIIVSDDQFFSDIEP
jgi:hypothetical protein